MTAQFSAVTDREQAAILPACILAAFADGKQTDLERAEIKRLVDTFSNEPFNLTTAYQKALSGKLSLEEITTGLQSSNARALAYEMAVCICLVDQSISPAEEQFLSRLRDALKLDPTEATSFQQAAANLNSEPPVLPPTLPVSDRDLQLDQSILNRSILAGALELMPQTLATMAIVPVQMHLVYQVGAAYGFKLDRGHVKEFLATVGIGITSQVVEGYLSKYVNKITHRFVGRLFAGIATQVAESAFAFGTTYALGHAAKSYYAAGRSLSPAQLKDVFGAQLKQANTLKLQYADQIRQKAEKLKVGDILPLVRQS